MTFRNWIKTFSDSRWDIGFITTPLDAILDGKDIEVTWVKHDYKRSWFADPFIFDVNENDITLLVEEYYKPIRRGRIARLIIDRDRMVVKQKDVLLELNSHLSFPAYRREGDIIFIYPENGDSGKLTQYIYHPKDNSIKFDAIICPKPLEDAVITDLFGDKLIFATSRPNPNGNRLEIFKWDEKLKEYTPLCEYEFEENVARMAGNFFEYEGKIYRPSQECNTQYGHAVTIQEVTRTNDCFYFKEVRRLYSVHPHFKIGMHTFNVSQGMIVTDALTFDRLWFRKVLIALHLLPKR